MTPAGVSKLPKSSLAALKKKAKGRIPLRELSEQEVFERDEAVLGDLRRRRSGEHGAFEIDSVLANPQASANENGRATSVSSSTHGSTSSQSTAATEVDGEDDDDDNNNGKIRVLKRSDSEEELRAKINAILENTASAKPSANNKLAKRKGLLTKATRLSPMKASHPAVRQSPSPKKAYHSEAASSSPSVAYSCGSPFSSPLKASTLPESPLRILHSPSPIVKPAPVRTGLGNKAINTILQDKSVADKGKKVIITSGNANQPLKKKTIAKKAGSSSLRRAAGSIRSASTISSVSSRLDEMRKMR